MLLVDSELTALNDGNQGSEKGGGCDHVPQQGLGGVPRFGELQLSLPGQG